MPLLDGEPQLTVLTPKGDPVKPKTEAPATKGAEPKK
jgi:hypothetical protein